VVWVFPEVLFQTSLVLEVSFTLLAFRVFPLEVLVHFFLGAPPGIAVGALISALVVCRVLHVVRLVAALAAVSWCVFFLVFCFSVPLSLAGCPERLATLRACSVVCCHVSLVLCAIFEVCLTPGALFRFWVAAPDVPFELLLGLAAFFAEVAPECVLAVVTALASSGHGHIQLGLLSS
jgi:hypothetical protein